MQEETVNAEQLQKLELSNLKEFSIGKLKELKNSLDEKLIALDKELDTLRKGVENKVSSRIGIIQNLAFVICIVAVFAICVGCPPAVVPVAAAAACVFFVAGFAKASMNYEKISEIEIKKDQVQKKIGTVASVLQEKNNTNEPALSSDLTGSQSGFRNDNGSNSSDRHASSAAQRIPKMTLHQ